MTRRYDEYVGSGSPWLSEVPVHWRVGRLDHVAKAWTSNVDKHSVEGQSSVRLCNYTDVYKNEAIVEGMEFMRATATAEQIGRFRLRRGDTIITKDSETPDDIGIPAYVEYEAEDLICGYHLAMIRPDVDVVSPRFLYWALGAQPTLGQWAVQAAGVTRVGIRSTDLSKATLALPPVGEQRTIADYLDRETAKIDALVVEQEGLVRVLRERRLALIARVIATGLNSDVSLRPSTLDWVDTVPAHWVVANIRRFAQMKTGHTPSRSNPEFWVDCKIPWFNLADVWQLRDGKRKYLGDTETQISELGLANSAAELLPEGTVVLSRTASVGFSGIMPRPMATSQDFWNWVCGPRLMPEYLLWVFRAMREEFNALMIGSTHKTIYQPVAAAIRIPVPPLNEQRQIADYLSEQTAKIDALIAEAEGMVAVAKERRSALITAAVTGQIDVRGEVA
jgi:type I restriction enzyme S subunit